MTNRLTLLLLAGLLSCHSVLWGQNTNGTVPVSAHPNQYFVKLCQGTDQETVDNLLEELNSVELWKNEEINLRLWAVESFPYSSLGELVIDILGQVVRSKEKSDIDDAAINVVYQIPEGSNFGSFSQFDQKNFKGHQGYKPIKISILDTGYDPVAAAIKVVGEDSPFPFPFPFHFPFDSNYDFSLPEYTGYDYVNNDDDPDDENGHGTHVAGIIHHIVNSDTYFRNVSFDIRKTHDKDGKGNIANLIIATLDAVDAGADIINMSFSFPGSLYGNQLNPLESAIGYAKREGVLIVSSAGNSHGDNDNDEEVAFPASFPYDNILSIASSGGDDEPSSFSSYGANSVDISALGEDIPGPGLSGEIEYRSGTSYSTAAVTALAAILGTRQEHFYYNQIQCIILGSAKPVESWNNKNKAKGVVDFNKALNSPHPQCDDILAFNPLDDVIKGCNESLAPSHTSIPTVISTCGGVSMSYTDDTSEFCGCGTAFTRIWEATDDCGNTRTYEQYIYLEVEADESTDGQIWLEAECGTVGPGWNTNSNGNASNGNYVTIGGGNSYDSAPNANGQITFQFTATQAGTYYIWARKIAPSVDDNSFWVQIDNGAWIKWNDIEISSSWQWDRVHNADNNYQEMEYNLLAGTHTLRIGYREDGTLLDKLYITNTTAVPGGGGGLAGNCVPTDAPVADAGQDQVLTDADNSGSESVSLDASGSYDPDGSIASYSWIENGVEIATGVSPSLQLSVGTHLITLVVTDNQGNTGTDDVLIQAEPGESTEINIWLEAECGTVGPGWNTNSNGNASNGNYVTIGGGNSYDSAPNANGQITFQFTATQAGTYYIWARKIAPSADDDSFWVQVDNGNWIKWNNIAISSSWQWDRVHNTDNNGQEMEYNLSAGTHTLRIGYREDGTLLDKLYITNTTAVPSGVGSTAGNCASTARTLLTNHQTTFRTNLTIMPNPAQGRTKLSCQLQQAGAVGFSIFDMRGELVWSANLEREAGLYEETINLENYPNGLYIINLQTGTDRISKKLVISK